MHFSLEIHLKAIPRILILWLVSITPVILSILLKDVPVGAGEANWLLSQLKHAITTSELFVYCATFFGPLFLIVYDRFETEGRNNDQNFPRYMLKHTFDGFFWVLLAAILTLVLTALTFGSINNEGFESSYLYRVMDRSVWGIYLFSLLCWYLAILDNLEGSGEDFVENNRERERDMTADFNERMKGQKENG